MSNPYAVPTARDIQVRVAGTLVRTERSHSILDVYNRARAEFGPEVEVTAAGSRKTPRPATYTDITNLCYRTIKEVAQGRFMNVATTLEDVHACAAVGGSLDAGWDAWFGVRVKVLS